MTARACGRCGRALGPAEGAPAPLWLARTAALACGLFHGGLWALEYLSHPFCRGCRRRVVAAAALGSAAVLAAAAVAARWWLRLALARD